MPNDFPPAPLPEPNLLIAVTGGPGSSKTRLLAEFAAAQLARGQPVEGVLALAGRREQPDQGAAAYRLRFLGSAQEMPWAVRDEKLKPPYYFEPETERKLRTWADGLRTRPPVPLLVLDEFGKFEIRGRGLMPLWPTLAAAAPHIVVMAVREEYVARIEQLVGRRFDVRVAATAPDALEQLRRACEDFGEWTRLGLFGGAAGGLEMTAGSALHAAKIPLTGLVMSSLQSAMLVFAGSGLSQPGRVVWVPFISGGLKALSPAGNRVRPMIAIVMQGLLFGASVQALGWNPVALALGGALVGAWAALQGFLLQYLMLGGDLVQAYDTLVAWVDQRWHVTAPGLPWLIGAWAVLHALVAAGTTLAAWRLKRPPPALQRIIEKEGGPLTAPMRPARTDWQRRLREFGHWQFWLPLLVVAAILLGSGRPWETVAWLTLRFVAVAGLLLALVSLLRPARWAEQLRRRGWWGPALALSGAIRRRDQLK
jgi:nucleoside-triphosphatase THEP1